MLLFCWDVLLCVSFQLYQKYTALFEGEWIGFMEAIGASSIEEIRQRLVQEMSEEEQSSKFCSGLLASMEYPKFAQCVPSQDLGQGGKARIF